VCLGPLGSLSACTVLGHLATHLTRRTDSRATPTAEGHQVLCNQIVALRAENSDCWFFCGAVPNDGGTARGYQRAFAALTAQQSVPCQISRPALTPLFSYLRGPV